MNDLYKKIILFTGYVFMAGVSAWWTTTSMHLKWAANFPLFVVLAMVLFIAFVAGWVLTVLVKQLNTVYTKLI